MVRRKRKSVRAFTLIEVLLVAGILAVLAAFAIPRLLKQAEGAKIDLASAAVGRNGPIAKALEAYKWNMGKYPDSDDGLAALFAPKGSRDERYNGPYLEGSIEELRDPWKSPYEYKSPGQIHEEGFDLWSRGPDGVNDEGKAGSDDVKNWMEK